MDIDNLDVDKISKAMKVAFERLAEAITRMAEALRQVLERIVDLLVQPDAFHWQPGGEVWVP